MIQVKADDGRVHAVTADGFLVEGVAIHVDLSEIIGDEHGLGFEGFLDLISERAGFPLLMEQEYMIIGHGEQSLTLLVNGNVSMHMEAQDGDADPLPPGLDAQGRDSDGNRREYW